jgi:hypothetical protein
MSEYQYGDAPVESQYIEQMKAVMRAIDEVFNGSRKGKDKKTAVVLMIFPYGEGPGRCNYMSNGVDRRDMITLMKEQIARFEGQPEIEGHA